MSNSGSTRSGNKVASRRRKGLPRDEQVAHNRRLLLDAAGKMFRELGYARASLDVIANTAGFSQGAVYSHFTSKADLFLSLLEERIAERAERLRAERLQPASERAIDDIVGLFTDVFTTSRLDAKWHLALLEFRIIAARDPALNARYAAAHRHTIEAIVHTLRVLYAHLGTEPELSLEALAVAGLMLDAGGFLENLVTPESVSAEQLADLFIRLTRLPATRRAP